jgi:hypothetical protein
VFPNRYFTKSYFPGRYYPPAEDAELGGGGTPSTIIRPQPADVYDEETAIAVGLLLDRL